MSGKPFRFSLQIVLDVRRRATERAEQALARATATRRAAEARLAAAEALAAASEPLAGALDPQAFRRRDAHRAALRAAIGEAARALHAERERETCAARALAECRRPQEALETLATDERSAHDARGRAAEQAFLDEITTTRRTSPAAP